RSRSVEGGVHSVTCVMSTVSGRSGAFELDGPVACIRPVWDPGCNTTRPLPSGGPVGEDGLMRQGAGRDLGTGPGKGRSRGPGAQMSRPPRAAATLGVRPNPFAALLWWWTRVATTATGPLRQLQSDPR